jgi:hypothetical protein
MTFRAGDQQKSLALRASLETFASGAVGRAAVARLVRMPTLPRSILSGPWSRRAKSGFLVRGNRENYSDERPYALESLTNAGANRSIQHPDA